MLSFVGVLTDLVIGFSVISSLILLVAYQLFLPAASKPALGRVSCVALLGALSGLQLFHLGVVERTTSLFDEPAYVLLLLLAPASFFFFSRSVLLPERSVRWWDIVHLVPAMTSAWLPAQILVPLAFGVGAMYSLWFAQFVYGMRRDVRRYPYELFFFGFFAVFAVVTFALIVSIPFVDETVFHLVYANFTGLSMILVTGLLIVVPNVVDDLSASAQIAYAKSTLNNVDVDACQRALEKLMDEERVYENEDLSLGSLAETLGIGAHQVSELVNTRYGVNFSRFVRERRVAAAKRMLAEDPQASVLSVGLSTGFRSQSNFYTAFQEITGQTPGAYRKGLNKAL